jgi:pimeloyl-ACP methyl ester carboxylesterase
MPQDRSMIRYRQGKGPKLLLIHGLGGTWRSWRLVLPRLTSAREVIVIDLPGHGDTPAEADSGTFNGLTASVERLLDQEGWQGVDVAGSSMGGRMVLELSRRGLVGAAVALDPGGFWQGWERSYFDASLMASGLLLRGLRAGLPAMAKNAFLRSLLLLQLSARASSLPSDFAADELRHFTDTATYTALVTDLYNSPMQTGPSAASSGPVTIGWGRQDRLCLPVQADRALAAFPNAMLHWFERCGHFPMWDQPEQTAELILRRTALGTN